MYCTNCGKKIEQDLLYCDQCGAQLKGQKITAPKGLGGWLVFFVLRLLGLAVSAVWLLAGNPTSVAIILVLTVASAVLFYMYNHLFRPVYIAAALFLLYSIMNSALQYGPICAIGFVYIDITMIIALFISKRVRNTFLMPGQKQYDEAYIESGPPIKKELVGYYGWLSWFQVNIVCSIAIPLAMMMPGAPHLTDDIIISYIIPILSIIPLFVCAVLFYQRKLQFQIAYVVYQIFWLIIIISNIYYAQELTLTRVGVVLGLAIQITITIALFRSRRVKNTFV